MSTTKHEEAVRDIFPQARVQQRLSGYIDIIDRDVFIGCGKDVQEAWADALRRQLDDSLDLHERLQAVTAERDEALRDNEIYEAAIKTLAIAHCRDETLANISKSAALFKATADYEAAHG